MRTLEEKSLRREKKRLKSEIESLEAIPVAGAFIAGFVTALMTSCTFPLSGVGFLLAFAVTVIVAFLVMAALFLIVCDEVMRLEKELADVRKSRAAVKCHRVRRARYWSSPA